MKEKIQKISSIFTKKQKIQLCGLLVMTIISTIFELLGVSAIMPFVNVAMNPDSIYENELLSYFYYLFHLHSVNEFLILLAILLVCIYILKNGFLILLYGFQYRFTYQSQRVLEGQLLSCYIHQDYTFHLEQNSAELQRNILQDVGGFYQTVLTVLQLLTEGLVCLLLFFYLLYTDITITIGVAILLSLFMLVFMGYLRIRIRNIGAESRQANGNRVLWIQQSLGGIKEMKILGREQHFLSRYDKNAEIYADKYSKYQMATVVPRPIMETLGISSLLLIVAYKLLMGEDISYMLPVLSVFAIAAFRLLPCFGRISGYLGTIAFNRAAVDRVCEDSEQAKELLRKYQAREKGVSEIIFQQDIQIQNISFRYPNTEKDVLTDTNIRIPRNKSVALIGPSGAGKTTMADILLGILEPQKGQVLVDGIDIYKNLDAWHQKLGYIPQTIYLIDDTIRNNIAFGIDADKIDEKRMIEAVKEAQLYDFIQELEEGLNTVIGEQGIRLSGGQRQRIGIARALYTNPEILVLDEATSALDNDTEKAIMEAIDMLQGSKTLIIIAHRLTTIKNCDYIYEIKGGTATIKDKKDI